MQWREVHLATASTSYDIASSRTSLQQSSTFIDMSFPQPPAAPHLPPDCLTQRSLHHRLRHLLRKHQLSSFSKTFMRDLMTVAVGAKHAAMLDFSLPNCALDEMLNTALASHPAFFSPLRLVSVFAPSATSVSAVFLVNRDALLLSAEQLPSPVLVNIHPSCSRPQLLTAQQQQPIIAGPALILSRALLTPPSAAFFLSLLLSSQPLLISVAAVADTVRLPALLPRCLHVPSLRQQRTRDEQSVCSVAAPPHCQRL